MNHKRKRGIKQRAACFCKFGKKFGWGALRGKKKPDGLGNALRLHVKARDIEL